MMIKAMAPIKDIIRVEIKIRFKLKIRLSLTSI